MFGGGNLCESDKLLVVYQIITMSCDMNCNLKYQS